MAIGVRSTSNTGNDASVSQISPAVPSGAAADDVVVAVLTRWENGTNPAVTPPSGFTHAGTQVIGGEAKLDIYWKRLTGADTGTYLFSWGTAMWSHVHCFCMTGVKLSGDPIGSNISTWTGTADTYGTTQLTTSFAPGLIWSGYNDSAGTHTPPTNFTEVIDFDSGVGAYYLPGAAGTYSAANASVTSSSNAIAVLIGLEPEPATQPPTVTTQAVTNITGSTATGNGTVVSDGTLTITERGVCWSTSANPTTSDSKATSAGTTGSYSVSMTGLSNGILYHARAYAINSLGTSYGADVTFTPYLISVGWLTA